MPLAKKAQKEIEVQVRKPTGQGGQGGHSGH